jgi:3-oxoacyl-[acyl-carrier protein] reductase
MNVLQDEKQKTQPKRLLGKVALVTGGSRGIGKAIALRLAEEGATVALTYAKSKNSADKLVEEIEAIGGKGYAYQADAQSKKEIDALVDQLKRSVGHIDILVNNAGVFEAAPLDQLTIDQYDRVFDVNVKGVVATTIAALPLIRDGGRIINISSGVATKTFPGASIYSASKAALNTLTRVWAQDLGRRRITVNAVSPGTTETDMYHAAMPEDMKKIVGEKTALGRVGTPNDIAAVVAFVASEDGGWVTGQAIEADGGLSLI